MDLLSILRFITGQKSIFPFYHAVSDDIPIHLRHLYEVRNSSLFEQDIQFFTTNYKSISATDIINYRNKTGFCISFDDGLREFKEVAWPILKKYNLPVILFVNPDFVDNKALFFRYKASILVDKINKTDVKDYKQVNNLFKAGLKTKAQIIKRILNIAYKDKLMLDNLAEIFEVDFNLYLQQKEPYLKLQELRELQAEGVIIGAHSMDHPLFNQLSLENQFQQIKDSTSWIKKQINPKKIYFSFPFTDYGLSAKLFSNMYKQNGFDLDLSFGTAGIKNERFKKHIQRIPLENSLKSAKSIVLGEYLYYLAKAPFFKNKIRR